MSTYPKDIEALITFLTPQEGGRKSPVTSGLRPTFIYDDTSWDATVHFDDVYELPKGEPTKVFFAFFSPKCHVGKLVSGKEFMLWDGQVIARGVVVRVIALEESAAKQANS